MNPRRAKMVCTLGPATRGRAAIGALIEAGMDVARLNFSHASHEEHRAAFDDVRAAADERGRAVAVLADLQGPKIRLGRFAGGRAVIEAGRELTLTTEDVLGTAERAATTYAGLPRDVKRGDTILLDDGALALEVLEAKSTEVRTRVIQGGVLSDHKGINLPGVTVSEPALTAKDRDDLRFALALGVDAVALSFVREPRDAAAARRAMAESGVRAPLIAKLEKPEAVSRLAEVIDAFDGLMVARGDLGVEMALEEVPRVQRRAVALARERGRPVIVATQMLESMVRAPRPTRAEVSDVATAVLEGADAVMLSAETSVGEHPIAAATTMARIVATTESEPIPLPAPGSSDPDDAIAEAAARMASSVKACALVAFTESGATARRLARHRPAIPILAFTPDPATRRRLGLVWGVESLVTARAADTDTMIAQVDRAILESGRGRPGDAVVVVAGMPPGTIGTTNTIRVHRLGEPSGGL